MKLLLVHSGNAVGGDSSKYTFVREQGEALQKQGCIVEYFAVVGHGLRGYLSNVNILRKKILDCKPDVVHAHYGLCGMVAILAAGNTPVVTTFHNGETLNRKVNILCSIFAKRAKYVIYVAQHIYDKCFLKAKNYTVMPCGVTMEDMIITPYNKAREQLGWKKETKYILFGGSISNKRKNFALLESALDMMGKKIENVDLCWLVDETQVQVIEMRGFTREDCVLRMCACDCFCLPSISEGSPQALKEAMACNCPAVATDMADIRQLFGDAEGYYISKFTVDKMAECIKQCLCFNGRTNGRGRILSLKLSNEQVAERLIEIYNQVMKE